MSDLIPVHVSYINGTIRDSKGKLVAFYDEQAKSLIIDGFVEVFRVIDLEHAMEIVGEKVPK